MADTGFSSFEIDSFEGNVVQYAKGNYIWSRSVMLDLQTIAKRTGKANDPIQIMEHMAVLAYKAVLELAAEKGQDFLSEFLREFVALFKFIFNNKPEIIKLFGPTALDYEEEMKGKLEVMLNESILRGLLVTIAKVNVMDIELPEPHSGILPVTSPIKKGK
jgi:hypothetical protein